MVDLGWGLEKSLVIDSDENRCDVNASTGPKLTDTEGTDNGHRKNEMHVAVMKHE